MKKSIIKCATLVALAAFASDANAQWSLTGNAGTNPATNFLGTTDNKNLRIRTNNQVRMSVLSNGKVGIGIQSPTSRLHVVGGTGAGDTVPVADVLVKFTGTSDVIGIRAASQPNPGYGIGMQALGNWIGMDAGGGQFGGTFSSAGFSDTTVATGADAYGVSASAGPAAYSIGVYGSAADGNFNYGVYGENSGLISDTSGSKKWAGYFYGDAFAIRFFQLSDNRFKSNIQPLSGALEKLSKIETATYTFRTTEFPNMPLPSGKQIGFLAENVKEVFPEMIKTNVSPRITKNRQVVRESETFNSVNYTAMIPVIVEAVKEQKAIVDAKDAKIAALESRLAALESRLAESENGSSAKLMQSNNESLLEQNNPNPFNESTTIRYSLPNKYSSAQLIINGADGKSVRTYSLSGSGKGQVILNAQELASGNYTYSLLINGVAVDTKSLVITR